MWKGPPRVQLQSSQPPMPLCKTRVWAEPYISLREELLRAQWRRKLQQSGQSETAPWRKWCLLSGSNNRENFHLLNWKGRGDISTEDISPLGFGLDLRRHEAGAAATILWPHGPWNWSWNVAALGNKLRPDAKFRYVSFWIIMLGFTLFFFFTSHLFETTHSPSLHKF